MGKETLVWSHEDNEPGSVVSDVALMERRARSERG